MNIAIIKLLGLLSVPVMAGVISNHPEMMEAPLSAIVIVMVCVALIYLAIMNDIK